MRVKIPTQRAFESEFGKLNARQLLYFELGYQAAEEEGSVAFALTQRRLGTVSGSICEFDQTSDIPSAEQLALAGYRAGREDADGLTAGQVFYACLVGELEGLIAWLAGYVDANRIGAVRRSAAAAAIGPRELTSVQH